MNGVTHGLGVVLGILACIFLSLRVRNKSWTHISSCAIYSTSLLVLYISSTLYHSFFCLQQTRYLFEIFDKSAIYILIAGSYTPFLQIVLRDNPLWSNYLLGFLWMCCFCGISVEAFWPTWKFKVWFSLMMYLGMGWSAVVVLPEVIDMAPGAALRMLVLGGVAYTSGVPFFVRNHNLDHSIWHLFVLAGSILHWIGIYEYVATFPYDEPNAAAAAANATGMAASCLNTNLHAI
jgi:hemolysin III